MNTQAAGFVPTHYEDRIKPPLITFSLLLIGIALFGLGIALNLLPLHLGSLSTVMMIIGGILFISCLSYTIGRSKHIDSEKNLDETRFYNWVLNTHGIVLSQDEVEQLYTYNFIVKDGVRYIMHYEIENNGIVGYLLFDKPASSFEFTSNLPIIDPITIQANEEEEAKYMEAEIPELVNTDEELIKEIENIPTEELEKEATKIEKEASTTVDTIKPKRTPKTTVQNKTNKKTVTSKPKTKSATKPVKSGLEAKTLPQLKELAKAAGIKGYYKMSKPELIKNLK